MLSEVFEVFDIPGDQREVIDQAACGYPRVIRRPGPASEVGVRSDGAPCAGHVIVGVEDVLAGQPASGPVARVGAFPTDAALPTA